jgi:hypothetical protein
MARCTSRTSNPFSSSVTGLRRFLRSSEEQSHTARLTPAKASAAADDTRPPRPPAGPTIGEIANYLVLRHHGGLIDRPVGDGLVKRNPDENSKSIVGVTLTFARHRQARCTCHDSSSGAGPSCSHDACAAARDRAGRREHAGGHAALLPTGRRCRRVRCRWGLRDFDEEAWAICSLSSYPVRPPPKSRITTRTSSWTRPGRAALRA